MLAERISFWTFLLTDFQGNFLRGYDLFPYFHVWGNWKCQETILFHKGRLSFWGFKKSVHLGLWKHIFNQNVLNDCGGCRSPNQAWFSFLKIPRCLVSCPKLSAPKSLWFRNYRSWSTSCSQEIQTGTTKLVNLFRRLSDINRGDSFSEDPKTC